MDEFDVSEFDAGFSTEEIEALKAEHAANMAANPPAPAADPDEPRKVIYIRLGTRSTIEAAGSSSAVASHPMCADAAVAIIADGSELWDMNNYDILDIFEQMGLLEGLPNMLASLKIVAAVAPDAEALEKATAPVPELGANLLAPENDKFTIGFDTLFEIQ